MGTPVARAVLVAVSVLLLGAAAQQQERCEKPEALQALEQGRKVQKEKGEGGAKEAIALYEKALELDPNCASALWEIGWSKQILSDWEGCLASWKKLEKLAPDYPELEAQTAVALRRAEEAKTLSALPEPGKLAPREEKPSAGERLIVAAVGDVHMGMAWPEERAQLPPDGGADLFESVTQSLSTADLTFGNLETVLADSGQSKKCGKKSTKCFAFRVPTAYAERLKQAGFDLMSIANNHAGDFGPEGRVATMAALDRVGIRHSGPIGDVASFELKGKKVAMVAFSTGGDVHRVLDLDVARRLVASLKAKHQLVLVSFHAGAEGAGAEHTPRGPEEFYGEKRGDVRAFAHTVIDAGADLVLGHGPHVLRGLERYRGRLILYSMGNFSSWETFGLAGTKGYSGIFKIELAPNGVATALSVEPVVLEEPGRPRPDPARQAIPQLRRLSKEDFGDALIDEEGRWSLR